MPHFTDTTSSLLPVSSVGVILTCFEDNDYSEGLFAVYTIARYDL